LLTLACVVLATVVAPPTQAAERTAADPGTTAVAGWIDAALVQVNADRTSPVRCARALALVSVAMDRAARTSGGVDAVHGAAATVRGYLFPAQAATFEARVLNSGASGQNLEAGRSIGRQVVELARSDGSSAVWSGSPPVGPQYWARTPPTFLAPVEPLAGTWKTWNIASGSVYRPGPPPRPGSARFEREFREVERLLGRVDRRQTRIAFFWADGAGTDTPPGHWNRIALRLIAKAQLPMRSVARVLERLNTAQADAFIAAWDAKYAYWSVRPVTVMRRRVDVFWAPLLATPAFPGYVSGHAARSGAASTVLARFFPRRAAVLDRMAAEAADSRLYAGIHFRADSEAGLALGRRVGRAALRQPRPVEASNRLLRVR
jgi:membrane-associated phospholipid phosphatase